MAFIVLGSRVFGFRFFGAEERKYAIVCITPHRVEKGYRLIQLGGIVEFCPSSVCFYRDIFILLFLGLRSWFCVFWNPLGTEIRKTC